MFNSSTCLNARKTSCNRIYNNFSNWWWCACFWCTMNMVMFIGCWNYYSIITRKNNFDLKITFRILLVLWTSIYDLLSSFNFFCTFYRYSILYNIGLKFTFTVKFIDKILRSFDHGEMFTKFEKYWMHDLCITIIYRIDEIYLSCRRHLRNILSPGSQQCIARSAGYRIFFWARMIFIGL
jgi:hypothetical protein